MTPGAMAQPYTPKGPITGPSTPEGAASQPFTPKGPVPQTPATSVQPFTPRGPMPATPGVLPATPGGTAPFTPAGAAPHTPAPGSAIANAPSAQTSINSPHGSYALLSPMAHAAERMKDVNAAMSPPGPLRHATELGVQSPQVVAAVSPQASTAGLSPLAHPPASVASAGAVDPGAETPRFEVASEVGSSKVDGGGTPVLAPLLTGDKPGATTPQASAASSDAPGTPKLKPPALEHPAPPSEGTPAGDSTADLFDLFSDAEKSDAPLEQPVPSASEPASAGGDPEAVTPLLLPVAESQTPLTQSATADGADEAPAKRRRLDEETPPMSTR